MSYSLYRAMIQRCLRHVTGCLRHVTGCLRHVTGCLRLTSGLAPARLAIFLLTWLALSSNQVDAESVSSSGETGVSLGGQDIDNFNMSLPGGLTTFIVILCFLIILSLWLSPVRLIAWSRLSLGGRLKALQPGPSASNLFLPMHFSVGDESGDGWLRAISLRGATMLVGKPMPKGANITLKTGALPDFPEEHPNLSAHVTTSRGLGGEPESWLIEIEWQQVGDQTLDPMRRYVESLCPKTTRAYGNA